MPNSQTHSANALIDQAPDAGILIKVIEMNKGHVDRWHQHPWHQLLFPLRGLLQSRVEEMQFVVPHTGALFIPADTGHESAVITDTVFIGIYLNPQRNRPFDPQPRALAVSPFLKALIQHLKEAITDPALPAANRSRLLDVLHDQIHLGEACAFKLLLPADRRLKAIHDALVDNPASTARLSDWARQVGASERTLSRLFMKELKMSFPIWRRHLRLMNSLPLLERRLPVQEVAFRMGYGSDSAFISAFKATFKLTPQQYRRGGHRFAAEPDRHFLPCSCASDGSR